MKNIFYIVISFLICAALSLLHVWVWFAAMYIILNITDLKRSILWEIPLGCLACEVATVLFDGALDEIFRILLPASAIILSFTSPKKLFIMFPAAIAMLALKNNSAGIYVMASTVFSGLHTQKSIPDDDKIVP